MKTRFANPIVDTASPRLLLIGVDHHCAPLEIREKVAYGTDEDQTLLERLTTTDAIAEACLLTTCNRTELYLVVQDDASAYRTGLETTFLERAPEIESEGRFYVKRGKEAARHLFAVASGLHSMILGEPEILGQVRKAARRSEELGASGTVLQGLLRSAIAASGRVRQETAISAGAISFGYAVVDLARNIFSRLESCSVLIFGAGETARQVARNLAERNAREIVMVNRSLDRAEDAVQQIPNARVVPFDDRQRALGDADVIVASTSATMPVLRHDDLQTVMAARRSRPLLVADLGVPRNVEVEAGELDNLFLQDIDSLEALIARNLKRRREEIPRVLEILDRELFRFLRWYRGLEAEPLVALLQKRAEGIRQREVEAVRRHFPAETHEQLDRMTRALVRKLLHHPSSQLRASDSQELQRLEVIRQLFGLDDD